MSCWWHHISGCNNENEGNTTIKNNSLTVVPCWWYQVSGWYKTTPHPHPQTMVHKVDDWKYVSTYDVERILALIFLNLQKRPVT